MTLRIWGWTAVLVGAAACSRGPSEALQDADGLVTVSRVTERGADLLQVAPARAGLAINAKSPPRFVAADGREQLFTGVVDPKGEKFRGAVTGRLPSERGTLLVSVCDSAAGICRRATVKLGA